MIIIGLDKRIEATFNKQLKKVDDDVLSRLFGKDGMFIMDYATKLPRLFTDKSKQLKKLFPVNFDSFKRYYEHRVIQPHAACAELSEMAFIEYAPIDFSKWDFLDKYFRPDSEQYFVRGVTPFMIAERHKNLDELRQKINEYPAATDALLPAIIAIKTPAAYDCLIDVAMNAGLEDSLRYRIFNTFLASTDIKTLAYFTEQATEKKLARFKSLKEAMTHTDIEYSVKFTADEYIKILDAVARGDCDKYLTTQNGSHRLLALGALIKYRPDEFERIAKRLLSGGDENIRRSVFGAVSCCRHDHPGLLELIADEAPTIAEFAAFANYLGYETMANTYLPMLGAKFARKFFDICTALFDGMEKVNYTFPATDAYPMSSSTSKTAVAAYAINAAAFIGDAKLVRTVEARYGDMPIEARARFWQMLDKQSTLDKRACAIEFLKTDNYAAMKLYDGLGISLTYAEAIRVSDYLKTKKQEIKNRILKEFLRSLYKDKIKTYLLGCKEDYKREIGKEMQAADGNIDDKKLAEKQVDRYWTLSDGASVLKFEKPAIKFERAEKRPIPHIDGKSLTKLYADLESFVEENKDYEYTAPYTATRLTIGSVYEPCEYGGRLKCFPLWEKVKAIFDELDEYAALDLYMLCCVSDAGKTYDAFHTSGSGLKTFEALRKKKPKTAAMFLNYIFRLYIDDYGDPDCAAEYLYQMFLAGLLTPKKSTERKSHWTTELPRANEDFPTIVNCALKTDRDDNIKRIVEMCDAGSIDIDSTNGEHLIAKAYERGLVDPEYLKYMLVNNTRIAHGFTFRSDKNETYMYSANFPYKKFRDFFKTVIEQCVSAELERGTLKTPYTPFVMSVSEIYGTELFAKAIVKMRGMTLVRNSDGYWFGDDKDDVISKILKTVKPRDDETFDDFKRAVEGYGVTRDELIRAAVYNLDFLSLVDTYLGIPGFKSAVLYFAAHLNESLSEARIEKIKEYSTIDYHDFKDGAFDFEWYAEMINTIPPDEFKRVYDNAKYITVAGLHKRAQRFFDALSGKITADEAKKRILESRNKDYCLIYSLIPLKDDADLFARYTFFGNFLKESKKFGSQRQLSERRTVDIAFDNLARNAGYTDSSVFIYEMESRDRRVIDMYDGITAGDYTLKLVVDGEKVKLHVTDKNGKKLASVPSAIAKTPEAVEIAAYKKTEEEKRKRLKRSLEEAMENETEFTRAQLLAITEQPLIRNFLERLILTDGRAAVALSGERFTDIETGKENGADRYKVAHPVVLKQNGALRAAMKYVIAHDIKQPFKQVFREIYTVSDGERELDEVKRYKGFDVNLKKAVAALKNRGWGVSEDIGLRKVYYSRNTVSAIFREFDYYYIYDFDDENRELESIMFLDRRDGHVMKIQDVSPVVFSETLRDVDLMIAISANNIYDHELAMSTFEMRHAMIESITDILGIKNVTFLKENVKVEGTYGTYVVNIRTGLTFKEGKGNLLIKTIDNYDKPLALDFIDEDPVTADIVTKVLILSDDGSIKDPAILKEIYG